GRARPEPVQTYSTSGRVYTDLGIPRDATGRLPLAKRTRAGLSAEKAEDFGGKRKSGPRSQSPAKRRPRKRTRGSRSSSEAKQETSVTQSTSAPEARTRDADSSAPGKSSGGGRRRRRRRGDSAPTSAGGDA